MFVRQARMPIDLMYETPNFQPTKVSTTGYTTDAYEQVRTKMGHSLDRQKERTL